MKRLNVFVSAILVLAFVLCAVPAHADGTYFHDNDGLFVSDVADYLEGHFAKISAALGFDVYGVTAASLNADAEYYYNEYALSEDGVIMVLSEDNEIDIAAFGSATEYFGDDELSYTKNDVSKYAADGDDERLAAFEDFANLCVIIRYIDEDDNEQDSDLYSLESPVWAAQAEANAYEGLFSAADAEDGGHFFDEADLLSNSEQVEYEKKLDDLSKELGYDVIFLSVNSIGRFTPRDFADDFYDQNGYGADGILFLVNMGERDWYFSTCGKCIQIYTDYGIEALGEKIAPRLSDKEYSEALDEYVEQARLYTQEYNNGAAFDVNHKLPASAGTIVKRALISLVIGLVIAFIATGSMKSALKTVRKQAAATTYVRDGSMRLTDSRDLFLYTNVTRTAIPKNNSSGGGGSSTHTSSGGVSHGGGGGKF